MDLCYIDESGDLGALPAHAFTKANHQPVFVVAGIFIHGDCLVDLTYDFLAVKKRFYPGLHYASEDFLDSILAICSKNTIFGLQVVSGSKCRGIFSTVPRFTRLL